MKIRWSGMTDIGKIRKNNEDAFLGLILDDQEAHYLGKEGEHPLDNHHFIFAVSDGMGGANAGEFASKTAVQTVIKEIPQALKEIYEPDLDDRESTLQNLFLHIHEDLLSLGFFYPEIRGMGATLSLCWLHNNRLSFAHVGDSRIYRINPDESIEQLSEDHSHVGWLLKQGKITESQARIHPQKNLLTQALGGGISKIYPQTGTVEISAGQVFVLCSDGITDGISNANIVHTLKHPNPSQDQLTQAQSLIQAASDNSGRDNLTAMVLTLLD